MPYIDYDKRQRTAKLYIQIQNYVLNTEEMRFIKSVKVVHENKKADTMELVIYDPNYYFFNSGIIQPTFYFTIYCGWEDEVEKKGPYRIKELQPNFPESGEPTYTIRCTDASVHQMAVQDKSVTYTDMTATQVVQQIAKGYNLKLDINILPQDEVTFTANAPFTQLQTDAQTLQRLANKMGYAWGVRDNTLYYQRPDTIDSNPYILEYRIGKKTIKSFKPKIRIYRPGSKKRGKKCLTWTDMLNQEIRDRSTSLPTPVSGDIFESSIVKAKQGIQSLKNISATAVVDFQKQQAFENPGKRFDIRNVSGEIVGNIQYDEKSGLKFQPYAEIDPVGSKTESQDGGTELDRSIDTPAYAYHKRKGRYNAAVAEGVIEPEVFKVRAIDGITGEETTYTRNLNSFTNLVGDPEAYKFQKPDSSGGNPSTEDAAKKKAAKRFRQKQKTISATIVPTVPSWRWSGYEVVYVVGVADMCEGLYTVKKVTLTYDNTKGLHTVLDCTKGKIGRRKKCKKGIICYEKPGNNGSINDPDNPRKPISTSRSERRRVINGVTGSDSVVTKIFR